MFVATRGDIEQPAWKAWFFLASAVLLLACAIYGTAAAGWWGGKVWPIQANRDAFAILAVGSFLLYFASLYFGLPICALLILPVALYIGVSGLAPLVAVIWIWACSVLIGAGVTALLGDKDSATWTLRNAAVGFAVIGTLVAMLAHLPVNIPSLYFVLFSLLAIVAAWRLKRVGRFTRLAWPSFTRTQRPLAENLLAAITLVGFTLVMAVTTFPELGYDALAFHLNIPAKMLETGMWRFDVKQYVWSVMPFGADWLLVPPYFLAGEQGARLLNSSFLLAIVLYGYRMLVPKIGPALAMAVPALLLTWPISFLEMGSTFIEAPLAFFFLVSLGELQTSDRAGVAKGRWMVLGAMAGFACSIKLLGVLIIPFLLVGALLRSRVGKFQQLTPAAFILGFAVFLVFALPPYVVAYLKTGNPVFPFYNSVFRSPDFIVGSMFGDGSDFSNPFYKKAVDLKLFWDMSIHSTGFGEFQSPGALGVVLLVLFPLSLLVAASTRRWWVLATLLVATAYVVLVFRNQAYLRYAFPVFPWLVIFGVWALSRLRHSLFCGTVIVLILCLINLLRFPVGFWPLQQFDLNLLWKRDANAALLLRSKPEAVAGQIISKMGNLKGKKILIVGLDPVYSSFPDGTFADAWHSWTYYAPSLKDRSMRTSIARIGAEIVVHTVGRGYSREAELLDITTELFRIGDVRVGLVKPDAIYTQEHIVNVELANGAQNWQLNGATIEAKGIAASESTPITQTIEFKSIDLSVLQPDLARLIRLILPTTVNVDPLSLEIQTTCPAGHSFRSTIRWMGPSHNLISEDVMAYPCGPDFGKSQHAILKPGAASSATISIASTDQRPVTFNRISLRSTE
ncbi:hypothetical protein V8G57_18985 [Collimonas sp. H4R21]|uniref:Glycosyltransferase RgtA/B/C/D-like domain-containing protein n=1 Tax=Collimonas rhizosphaerae TaxID=3126357 RepID=A0ABU9PZQ4_9BURK